MAADPQHVHMTVAEFFKLAEESDFFKRYEYWHGYAVAMAGGRAKHSRVKMNLAMLFNQKFSSGPCNAYDADMYVKLAEDVLILPDLSVSCDAADHDPDNLIIRSPYLVIEALSDSTEGSDRKEKATAFRQCESIQEYAFVNTRYQLVEVFRRIPAEHEDMEDMWISHFYYPDQDAVFESLGISISVSDIYRRTSIPRIEDLPPSPRLRRVREESEEYAGADS